MSDETFVILLLKRIFLINEKGVKNNGYFKLGKKGKGDCLQKRKG